MNEFSIFLDYYFSNNDKKHNFIKNVYELKKLVNYVVEIENNTNKLLSSNSNKNFLPYSTYSLEDHDIKEFFAEIFSKYIVSNISNDFIMELLKIRHFYYFYQIEYFTRNGN